MPIRVTAANYKRIAAELSVNTVTGSKPIRLRLPHPIHRRAVPVRR